MEFNMDNVFNLNPSQNMRNIPGTVNGTGTLNNNCTESLVPELDLEELYDTAFESIEDIKSFSEIVSETKPSNFSNVSITNINTSGNAQQSLLIHQNNLDELEMQIDRLKNMYNVIANTNQMFVVNSINESYNADYYSLLNQLIYYESQLKIMYEHFINSRLCNAIDIIETNSFEFINLKLIIIRVIKCATDLLLLSTTESTIANVIEIIERTLFKCMIITKQPPQVLNSLKAFNANIALVIPFPWEPFLDPVVTVKLLSEKALHEKLANTKVYQQVINNSSNQDYLKCFDVNSKSGLRSKTFNIIKHVVKKCEKATRESEYTMKLEYNQNLGIYEANFENMKINNFDRKAIPIKEDKYAVVFETNISIQGRSFNIFVYSLPIIVVTHIHQESNAYEAVCWDTCFASVQRIPFATCEQTKWGRLKLAFDSLYRKRIGQGLSHVNCNFLFLKLNPTYCSFDNYDYDEHLIGRAQVYDELIENCKTEDNKRATVFEWFDKTLLLTEMHMKQEWVNGYIHGLISKKDAEQLIINYPPGTFLLRFSETSLSALSIVCVLQQYNRRFVEHYGVKHELKKFSLQEIVHKSKDLEQILSIDGQLISKQNAFVMECEPKIPDGYKKLDLSVSADRA